jgi:hypothetical protein
MDRLFFPVLAAVSATKDDKLSSFASRRCPYASCIEKHRARGGENKDRLRARRQQVVEEFFPFSQDAFVETFLRG